MRFDLNPVEHALARSLERHALSQIRRLYANDLRDPRSFAARRAARWLTENVRPVCEARVVLERQLPARSPIDDLERATVHTLQHELGQLLPLWREFDGKATSPGA